MFYILPDFNLPFAYQEQTVSVLIAATAAAILISIMIATRFIVPWE